MNSIDVALQNELESHRPEHQMLLYVLGLLPVDDAARLKHEIDTNDEAFQLFEKAKGLQNTSFAKVIIQKHNKDQYKKNLISKMLDLHFGLLPSDEEEELREMALEDDDYCEAYETAGALFISLKDTIKNNLRDALHGTSHFAEAFLKSESPNSLASPLVDIKGNKQSASFFTVRHLNYLLGTICCFLLVILVSPYFNTNFQQLTDSGTEHSLLGSSKGQGEDPNQVNKQSDNLMITITHLQDHAGVISINNSMDKRLYYIVFAKDSDNKYLLVSKDIRQSDPNTSHPFNLGEITNGFVFFSEQEGHLERIVRGAIDNEVFFLDAIQRKLAKNDVLKRFSLNNDK